MIGELKQYWLANSVTICCAAAGIWIIWHFFVRRWIEAVLYKLGFLRYSDYDDEQRGFNEHIRLLRKKFRYSQKLKRKCYYRLVPNKDGTLVTKVLNDVNWYMLQCLETGEKREMEEDWLREALHFRIISNAECTKRGDIRLVDDVNTQAVPEFNKKVGDISYFNLIIGAYDDWSAVKMDVDAVNSSFY